MKLLKKISDRIFLKQNRSDIEKIKLDIGIIKNVSYDILYLTNIICNTNITFKLEGISKSPITDIKDNNGKRIVTSMNKLEYDDTEKTSYVYDIRIKDNPLPPNHI